MRRLIPVVILILIILRSAIAQTSRYYTITDLSPSGAAATYAYGINNAGQVAGVVRSTNATLLAITWPNSNNYQTHTYIGTFSGGTLSFANGINNSGDVVGYADTSTGIDQAFIWFPTPLLHDLGQNNVLSTANGVNDSNHVVGQMYGYASVWHTSTSVSLKALPGGSTSTATAINNANPSQVVGSSGTATGSTHAFLYTFYDIPDPQPLLDGNDLGTLGGQNSYATAVNDAGQAVGYSDTASGLSHAFLLSSAGQLTPADDLGTLYPDPQNPGQYLGNSTAYGINNYGQVVGTATASTGQLDAFVWDTFYGMRDLNTLLPQNSGWTLSQARWINDKGIIVGIGKHNGRTSAFVMTPPYNVLMVHGIFSSASIWNSLTSKLIDQGFIPEAIDFNTTPQTQNSPHGGPAEAKIEFQAQAIAAEITKLVTNGQGQVDTTQQIDMVCHSMGGLAARYYLESPNLWPVDTTPTNSGTASACVRKLITLGTPHWGTDIGLANPLGAVVQARRVSAANVDTIDDWSDGLNEMYAEWMPPHP